MAKLYYQPGIYDPDSTVVDNITFAAYEAIELDDAKKADLIAKLKRNQWFGTEISEERHGNWKAAREAQAEAKEHRAKADALENSVK